MHGFSPGRHGSISETAEAFIAAIRGIAQHGNPSIHRRLSSLSGRTSIPLYPTHVDTPASRHEVEIMYSGHAREFLMMTSERMVIPSGRYTLGQLLCNLYKRGDRWMDELDDSHLMCTVDGREASLFDPIAPGAEIRISS
jgi:hypothetical protein